MSAEQTRTRLRVLEGDDDLRRPVTRGDCASVPRPCPFASCRFSLLANVDGERVDDLTGDGDELPEASCALDVAADRDATLEEIGRMFGVTKEYVRDIESQALRKLARRGGKTLAEYSVARR